MSELQSLGEGTFRLPDESGTGPTIFDARKMNYGPDLSVGLVVQDDESEGELWALLQLEDDAWVGECGFAQYGTLDSGWWEDDVDWSGSADTVESFADQALLPGDLELTRATDALPAAEGDPFEPDACRLEEDEADVCFEVTVVDDRRATYRRVEFHDDAGRVTSYAQGDGTGDWELAGFYTWSSSGGSAAVATEQCAGGSDLEEEWEFDDAGYESRYEMLDGYDTITCSITTEVVGGARVSASWWCSQTCLISSGEGPYRYNEEVTYGADGRPESVVHSGESCMGFADEYTEWYTWEEC